MCQSHSALAEIGILVGRVAHPREYRFVGAEQSPLDGSTRQQRNHAFRERAHLVRPFSVVTVEVFLQQQRSLLIHEDRTDIWIGAIDEAVHEALRHTPGERARSRLTRANTIREFHWLHVVVGDRTSVRAAWTWVEQQVSWPQAASM